MYSTAYLSSADWNDTKFNNPNLTPSFSAAKAELDGEKRKALYSEMGQLVRDEGGLICPMFNDFIDGVSDKLGGWEIDPNGELMNGQVTRKLCFA